MPRKKHTHHYIYKVTCNVTGKYYIGMHSTSNLEDRYFGSGKVLKRSLNKYGKENHSIEILEWLTDRSSLKLREREIVNEVLLSDPLCMNLQLGGGGGFSNSAHQLECSKAGGLKLVKFMKDKLDNDPEWAKEYSNKVSNGLKNSIASGKFKIKDFSGKKHSDQTKQIIGLKNSISQLGQNNSQYGTCWITNGIINKKIKKSEASNYLLSGWTLGRNIKKITTMKKYTMH